MLLVNGVLWAVTKLATNSYDASILGYPVGGIVMLGVFVLVERVQAEPMVHLSLFTVSTMSPSMLASLFRGLANYAVPFLVIMHLQGPRGLTPLHASLLLVPGYVIGGVIAAFSGRLSDRIGPVIPATAGIAIQIMTLFLYAQLPLTTGLRLVVLASIISGISASSFFPA